MEAADGATDRSLASLIRAFHQARDSGDAELMEQAAISLPSTQSFGAHPGQVPALVHEAYSVAATPVSRCRLAAALARAWAYGGSADRAVTFADEAVALAEDIGDTRLLVDALDAALLARWGPDMLAERLQLAARLADAAAHLADPEVRLSAHLWRLTTAWECLDIVAVQRQLRALDMLAEDTGLARVAFFAASRRAMHAIVTADLDVADQLIARTQEIGAAAAEPDVDAVVHNLVSARALRASDVSALQREAAAFQEYGTSEGVPSVSAEGAVLWLAASEHDRALDLLHQLAGSGLALVPRDVYFLLTVSSLTEVASALHRDEIAAEGVRLLEPFAGRAVLNAGAVTFHGVVDDYLCRACRTLGRADEARWRDSASSCYRRIGATWWWHRLAGAPVAARPSAAAVHLRPGDARHWVVGRDGATTEMTDLKGLRYLHQLLLSPCADISSLDLAASATSNTGTVVLDTSRGEVIDARALAAYRQRLRDIDLELAEAESWADRGRLERLQDERAAVLAEVRAATGLGGRHRQFTSSAERARVAVRKAITAALDVIDQYDSALGRLLRDTVRTGAMCRYDPDPSRPVAWVLAEPGTAGQQAGDEG
jgi:hypothetical protein